MKHRSDQHLISSLKLLAVLAFVSCASMAWGGETGPRVKITQIRPYMGSGQVFLHVDSSQLCGTSVFKIVLSDPAAKEAYAAALTALATKKKVALEVSNATGCAGWGTQLQSIWLDAD